MAAHREDHVTNRIGWLRAAVLGANDGLLSTASLVAGVAAGSGDRTAILLAGLAGAISGALSMAAGEYVSVSSQRDAERSDLARETQELQADPEGELNELTAIYASRGLDEALARTVATQMMQHDALAVHAREELGIDQGTLARPVQAAAASAASFAAGAIIPVATAYFAAAGQTLLPLYAVTLAGLALLGGLGAWAGKTPIFMPMVRVVGWGALAMVITSAAGWLFGVAL
ncbi:MULTISPECIES: VIT family protein [unclassified Devosia]|jgi:VIT1/CCC1 family predicted Fe2+/Mn2+ transporter|uniref:VIT1/CCC1 transporter family protein n=1 Tax=unclassified Devosia TaxID=196773 RepID=UPI000FDAA428|nr:MULTISPECIES: VIT family protein [unclassified Devosia]